MKKFLVVLIAFILVLPLSSDAQLISKRKLATQDGMMEMELYNVDFTEVLWYISLPIEIERLSKVDPKSAEGMDLAKKGKINIKGGKLYEIARFTINATGLYEDSNDSTIAIRYEHGEGRILEFRMTTPNNAATNAYLARYFELIHYKKDESNKKYVNYAGAEWTLLLGGSCKLEYKAKINTKSKTKKNRIRGLKKDGSEKKSILNKVGL